jgi:hypothetical protein
MERIDYLEESDYADDRVITRGALVRLFDLIRAQAKLDERRYAWLHDEEAALDRRIYDAKAQLMTDVIEALKAK